MTKTTSAGPKKSARRKFKPIRLKVSKLHKPEDLGLEEWQRLLRKQFGEQQNFQIKNTGNHPIFSDFLLTNPLSRKTYKIAVRGDKPGDNYCSCPDYAINNLGTCKHIEFTLSKLLKKRGAATAFRQGYIQPYSEVYLRYGLKREVRFKAGKDAPARLISLSSEFFDRKGTLREDKVLRISEFLDCIKSDDGHELRCYDDVLAYIAERQDAERRRKIVEAQFRKGLESPIFKTAIRTELYPYQREGAMFAVKAGRCLIGDDMGLGKTIQALAAAELMARLFNIQKVLIISPTSLKYQWKGEIEKFTGRTVEVIDGLNLQRRQLYRTSSFYKLLNYELVFRDMPAIREWSPDLIILDEAQRIKNWKTRTAQVVKQLDSSFAIVLTGTPIENRIEELHSIMEFIDRRCLGPLYRFVHAHRITDTGGKVVGYRNLQAVRESLKDVMLRRKKDEVLKQLPARTDKNFFVPMTAEQADIHEEYKEIVAKLVAKWRRYKFLSEADLRRLQIALNMMRMAADNTYLVDKKTVHGPKIEELEIILREIVVEGGEKVVIFSQWLRMTELVERILERNGIGYVHLNGGVPSRQRKDLISRFREDPKCMVFLSTDAGGVGLNLQSGSVVINIDIPWNPAVLEQRIGRVHRLGQVRCVRVINFVSSGSIEERILELLKFKKSLFAGALDSDGENVVMIGESQLKRFMKSVEATTENLPKAAPEIERQQKAEEEQAEMAAALSAGDEGEPTPTAAEGSQPSDAIGQLLISGAQFLMDFGKMLSGPASAQTGDGLIADMTGKDEKTGKAYLKIPLPGPDAMNNLISVFRALATGFQQKY